MYRAVFTALYAVRSYIYITLHYKTIYSGQSKKNCKVHYGASHTTMSGYDCRNKCVLSFRRNDNSDVAVVTSRGRVFQILGPAVANERSPTVTRRDGRTSRRLVDDDRRRVLAGMSAM